MRWVYKELVLGIQMHVVYSSQLKGQPFYSTSQKNRMFLCPHELKL